MAVNAIKSLAIKLTNVWMFVGMAYNGVLTNRNVSDLNCQTLMILASITKGLIRIIISVKIIVIVLLLGMIGLIMFVLKLDVVSSAGVGRFLIIPLEDVFPKENNVPQVSITILRLDNARLNVNQIPHTTPYRKPVFRQLIKVVLMINSLIVKH